MIEFQKKMLGLLDTVIHSIKGVINYPLELIFNVSRILKFSIRSKITMTYVILYTWITIITAIIVLGGTFYFYIEDVSASQQTNLNEVQDIIDESNGEEKIEKSLDQLDLDGTEILIQNLSNEKIGATTDNSVINQYEVVNSSNPLYRITANLSLLAYSLYPKVSYYNGYIIIFFYDVHVYLYNMFFVVLLMSVSYVIGFICLWVIGSAKTKKVLKPIKQFTKSAQSINAKNLDIRIDVGVAKYELKDLAQTMNGMMDRIEDSYVKQQQFVSDVSHELRTPISVINGYANMLDRWGKDNPEILQESIDALKNEANNMEDLVEKLLFLARYDGDSIRYEMTSINLSEIVEEIANETEMIDSNHQIIRNISPSLYIYGDYNRIKQVIRVFADNAIKYTLNGNKITIQAYSEENMAVVNIKDRGVGISKKDLNNVFDRFYRADKARTKNSGGYGLGLSIAKIIVLQHKGKIIVRSKLGVGSEFKILLPLQSHL